MRPSADEALRGLSMVADGLRLLDQHFGALPPLGRDHVDNSALAQIDALGVDRLRAALAAMQEFDHA